MRRRVLFATLGAIIVGSGVFAAVGLGGDNRKAARVGQPVEKRIKRSARPPLRPPGRRLALDRGPGR